MTVGFPVFMSKAKWCTFFFLFCNHVDVALQGLLSMLCLVTLLGGLFLLGAFHDINQVCQLGADSQGVVLLGDSAGAHFHIPPEWMTVTQMSTVRNCT